MAAVGFSLSNRWPTFSSTWLSPMPVMRRVRLCSTRCCPSDRKGRTCSVHRGFNSLGGPGSSTARFASFWNQTAGAVPLWFSNQPPFWGTMACFSLWGGMCRPVAAK